MSGMAGLRIEHDDAGKTQALNVLVDTGDGRGLLPRFSIENNPSQSDVDLNFRNVAMVLGSTVASSSPGVGIDTYAPAGASGQVIRVFKPGSTTITKFYIQRSGSVVLADDAGTAVMTLDTAGDIYFHNSSRGPILRSPDGTRWRLSVADDGTLSTTAL